MGDTGKLSQYRGKRDFAKTAEPRGEEVSIKAAPHLRYVIQKHAASHLHYDLRLELDGVFKSWAVPKGPSLDPDVRRSAFEVEDHPLAYGDFEGTIPPGEYGAGAVQVWDRGFWAPAGDHSAAESLRRGAIDFVMEGERLHGEWLLRRAGDGRKDRRRWLLIKRPDAAARPGDGDRLLAEDRSVASGRTMQGIAAGRRPAPKPFLLAGRNPGAADAVWHSNRTASAPRAALSSPPKFVAPQLSLLVEAPPDGADWVHEIKWDGYRIHIRIEDGVACLLTRTGLDWTHRYKGIAKAAAAPAVRNAYLDGELCALRPDGTASFDDLQAATDGRKRIPLVYFAFDLLYLDGEDLRKHPLRERKQRLRELAAPDGPVIRYSEHFAGDAQAFFATACAAHVEGIVSKRLASPYVSENRGLWRKTKCYHQEEFVIVGYTDPKGARPHVGSILLAYYAADGRLVYAGRGGRGITDRELARLIKRFKPLVIRDAPLDVMPPTSSRFGQPLNLARVRWMRPELVCAVKFLAWTEDAQLREVIYVGLREDKPASEVRRPIPTRTGDVDPARRHAPPRTPARARGKAAPRWNVMHLLPDAVVPAREDLERYWRKVGKRALKYLARRPLTLVRHTRGITFFHKRRLPPIPDAVHSLAIEKREGGEGVRVWVDSVAGLVALLDMDAVELHPWGATVDDIEHPDLLVFDLDPGAGTEWALVRDTALLLRDVLRREGYRPWPKTSGGKGLHVMVPLPHRDWDWDQARAWSKSLAMRFAGRDPRYTASSAVDRTGRVFIDYLRNGRGSSAVGAYSPRARAGFPVSMPVTWRQVEAGIRGDTYTMARLLKAR